MLISNRYEKITTRSSAPLYHRHWPRSLSVRPGRGISCIYDFRWLQFISSLVPAIIAWCYWPGVKMKKIKK